jgi:serine/threonine protein phosphatase PrpC
MTSKEKKLQEFQPESPPLPQTRIALWIRLITTLAVLLVAFLLYRLPGGFPPHSWVRLVALVQKHPLTLEPSLLVPVLQALALLVAWVLLLFIALRVMHLWRFDSHLQLAQPPTELLASEPISEEEDDLLQDADHVATASRSPSRQTSSDSTPAVRRRYPQGSRVSSPMEEWWREQASFPTLLTARSCGGQQQHPLDGSPGWVPFWLSKEQREVISLAVSADARSSSVDEFQSVRETTLFSAAGLCPSSVTQKSPASLQPLGLFLLADGFVYQQAGEYRSTGLVTVQLGAQTLLPLLVGSSLTLETEAVGSRILDAILHTNATLYRQLAQEPVEEVGRSGRTALAALLVLGKFAYIASVGNSRAYLFRTSAGLVQVTYDHPPAPDENASARQGGTKERANERSEPTSEVQDSPARNARIYRSLGEQEQVEPDLFALELEVGDILLLCSEGLWSRVERSTLEETLKRAALLPVDGPHSVCWTLCQDALASGSVAPFSLIVVQTIAHPHPGKLRRGRAGYARRGSPRAGSGKQLMISAQEGRAEPAPVGPLQSRSRERRGALRRQRKHGTAT